MWKHDREAEEGWMELSLRGRVFLGNSGWVELPAAS